MGATHEGNVKRAGQAWMRAMNIWAEGQATIEADATLADGALDFTEISRIFG